MTTERRQFARLDTRLPITYRVISLGSPPPRLFPPATAATTKDVGGGGLCLFLETSLPIGTRLEVAITLPDQDEPVVVTGEIAWCERYELRGPVAQPPMVQAGVRFVQVDPLERQRLMRYLILHLQPPTPA